MSKICTDINQSKKLLELGIDVNTADMSYRPYEEDGISGYLVTLCPHRFASWIGIPCWSLSALLNIIHYPTLTQEEDNQWFACSYPKNHLGYASHSYNNPLDACYEMTVWLKENEKI